jgi:acetyl esterase/lipase
MTLSVVRCVTTRSVGTINSDCMVGSGQSGLLVAALKQSGVPVQYDQFPGASHGGSQFETPENIRKIISFIHSHQISPETP